MENPIDYFSNLSDPRVDRTREHNLEDILFIAIASVICGAKSWNDMETFGNAKGEWLQTFLKLSGGIPSHDTFNRVFSALNPQELEKSFIDWTRAVALEFDREVIAIDGKSLRGSRSHGNKSIVHMVSARAEKNHIVPSQVKVDEKSNEITVIPRLPELPVMKSCIVSVDAMGCRKEIAAKTVEKEADYLPALKGSKPVGILVHPVVRERRFTPVFHFPHQHEIPVRQLNKGVSTDMQMHRL